MIFHLKCPCGATASAPGWDEPDVNACGVYENHVIEWEGGKPDCDHEDYEITGSEYDEPDVWGTLP